MALSLRQLFIHCKECCMSTLGKEYAILLKTKTKTETRIKTMKLYNTDFPSNDVKVKYGDAFREGDTLADWLARNGKEF